MSRMVEGVPFWDDVEKEALDRLLRKMASFLGVRLLTHAVMGNHFHALLEIPNKAEWLARFEGPGGEQAFWTHLASFYQGDSLVRLRRRVDDARKSSRHREAERMIDSIKRRMCDVSIWAKEVKERYSRWLNRRRNRQGTIWMERFRNVLVQDGRALQSMAAYIELNPVRASLVGHPKDYRWCGLAAAQRGDREAMAGIRRLHALATGGAIAVERALGAHESLVEWWLAENTGADAESPPTRACVLRRQCGFSEGMALGEASWIDDVACQHESHFGRYRRGKPEEIPGAGGSMVLRLNHRVS